MPSRINVQNTHMSDQLRALHGALLDIVGAINRPERDDILIQTAGIRLDRALFPLLVSIERFGPVGVVELAGGVGRDYTTVSRQVAKLESLGLVKRQARADDGRVHEARVTPKGKAMTDQIDTAREKLVGAIFAQWSTGDVNDLVRLTRRFADAFKNDPPGV